MAQAEKKEMDWEKFMEFQRIKALDCLYSDY